MIEIRPHFSGWHKVNRETAKGFAERRMRGMVAIPGKDKTAYIESECLKGITVKELFK